MIDYFPDGKIDCKDYAIYNSIQADKRGYEPRWVVIGNHVVVLFTDGRFLYIADNGNLFRTVLPNH